MNLEALTTEMTVLNLNVLSMASDVPLASSRHVARVQRRSQEFDLGGYKLHDIEFVLGEGDKTTTKNLR